MMPLGNKYFFSAESVVYVHEIEMLDFYDVDLQQ